MDNSSYYFNIYYFQGSDGVLYIRQKENVVTFHGDKFDDGKTVKKLGTQDVLTCHVVTLHHPVSNYVLKSHHISYKLSNLKLVKRKLIAYLN